jgi:NADH-quinone oxidoreductase subunit J
MTFVGIAVLFLQLGAQFVGFSQILVYLGAVAILIVFAILLTRDGMGRVTDVFSSSWWIGGGISLSVTGLLVVAVVKSSSLPSVAPVKADLTVQQIGETLMGQYVLPLEVIAVLLTATLIGAVVLARHDPGSSKHNPVNHS